ncbi:MAG: methyltransferase domain-containing protein [Bacteroidales bacterium]|nr:methyltransferase domain-containing protein [Bacteroidales bacterium]
MKEKDWNPQLYLKFDTERAQPSIDLVNRINLDFPAYILDVGCGPGNSTQVLVNRWPESKITGIDNSPAMIERAGNDYPKQEWILMDASNISLDRKYDLIFSNATIQWVPDHKNMLKNFYLLLTEKGVLAVQIPLFWDMPLGKSIRSVADKPKWNELTKGVYELFTIHNSSFYYDELSKLFRNIHLWETYYIHIMESHKSIIEMVSSTGLKPYIERFEREEDSNAFINEVFERTLKDYSLQNDSKVLFPFKRLFFVAYK